MQIISDHEREQLIGDLARFLEQRGLASVALLLAQSLSSLSVVISHTLLLAQPLLPYAGWRRSLETYAVLFEEQASWQALIDRLEASNS